jgi:hypothetical protein
MKVPEFQRGQFGRSPASAPGPAFPNEWISFLHLVLGLVSLALLGFTFLLIETGDWLPFLTIGAASCGIGAAASGLSAYYRQLSGIGGSILFALPVLLVGVAFTNFTFPRIGLPVTVWCILGILMFIASWIGGRLGVSLRKATARTRRPATI